MAKKAPGKESIDQAFDAFAAIGTLLCTLTEEKGRHKIFDNLNGPRLKTHRAIVARLSESGLFNNATIDAFLVVRKKQSPK